MFIYICNKIIAFLSSFPLISSTEFGQNTRDIIIITFQDHRNDLESFFINNFGFKL